MLSHFPIPPEGQICRAWVLHGGRWTFAGSARPDREGHARIVVEDAAFAVRPDAVEVTFKRDTGVVGSAPSGSVIVSWRMTARGGDSN
jgi:hypothetical protein